MTVALRFGALAIAALAGANQSASGRVAGSWRLNTYLSDSPAQIAQALRYNTDEARWCGDVGRRPARGSDARKKDRKEEQTEEKKDSLAPEDRKRLKEFTDAVQFAPTRLTISEDGSDVTLTTLSRGVQTLHVTGKAESYTIDAGTIKRTAEWEGPTLIVTYDLGRGGTLRYTYLVVPTTGQLLVRVGYERPSGEAGPFEIRLVYDPTAAS
jgi:hypothetical protein